MTGASPRLPDLPSMRLLLEGARTLGGAHGAVLELCILTTCLPWEAVAIKLELIEWRRGIVVVPARGRRGRTRMVPLSNAALQLILRVAGRADGKGQAVTGGRGRPIRHQDVRLDRVRHRLARAVPDTEAIRWNFHGLRAAAVVILSDAGVADLDVQETLGLRTEDGPTPMMTDRTARMIATAEIWSRVLHDDHRRSLIDDAGLGRHQRGARGARGARRAGDGGRS